MRGIKTKTERFIALEGVRGVAALIVVVHHFLLAFFPGYFHGVGTWIAPVQHMRFEDNLYGSPFNALLSGPFSVAIFFVLSGFVLSIGFFQTNKISIVQKLALKRYPRLMLPALASVFLCYLLLKLGTSFITEATAVTSSGWLANNWNFAPQIEEAIRSGVIGIFTESGNIYNGVLWTMTTEFIGSFMVFGFLLMFANSSYRWLPYLFLIGVTYNSWYLGFIIGMIMADIYANGYLQQKRNNLLLIIPLVLVGIVLGGYPAASLEGTFYQFMQPLANIPGLNLLTISLTLGASVLIASVLMSNLLTRLFETRRISHLGRYTFSVYLTHLPVLFTFGVGSFVFMSQYLSYNFAALVAILLSIPILAITTVLFEKYIDAPAVRFAGYVGDVYVGKRSLPNMNDFQNQGRSRFSAHTSSLTSMVQRGIGFAPVRDE